MEKTTLSEVHSSVLDKIERSERNSKMIILGIALFELVFLAGFILLADFDNRIHLLLFLATIAMYSILVLGMLVLGIYIKMIALKIITAVENKSAMRPQ